MLQALCYNLLMIRQLSLIFSLIFIVSCANEEQPTEQDAKDFLAEVQLRAETEGPVIYSASWISSNFITYDSQVVLADFSKRYTLKSLEQARVASTFDDLEFCLLYTSPSPRDATLSRMPSSA